MLENRSSGFPTRSHTNRAVQPHKMARGLEFLIWEVEGLYYPCSENKGTDQLRGYREADLRLCFRICKKAGFLTTRLILSPAMNKLGLPGLSYNHYISNIYAIYFFLKNVNKEISSWDICNYLRGQSVRAK